jgi:hypothetical protein
LELVGKREENLAINESEMEINTRVQLYSGRCISLAANLLAVSLLKENRYIFGVIGPDRCIKPNDVN